MNFSADYSYPFFSDDSSFIRKMPLTDYVIWCLGREISNDHLDLIEAGFLDLWNRSTGMYIGDADLKNHVHHYLESMKLEEYPPQDLVDEVVDLMLDYMEKIGEYSKGYSEN